MAALGQRDGRDRRRDVERRVERLRIGQALAVEGMDGDLRAGVFGDRGVVTDVVPVAVGRDDELEGPVARGQLVGDPGEGRDRGVDGDRLATAWVGQDVDVGRGRPDDPAEAFDHFARRISSTRRSIQPDAAARSSRFSTDIQSSSARCHVASQLDGSSRGSPTVGRSSGSPGTPDIGM